MQSQPISARFSQLRRTLVGPLAVALALGAAEAHAQTVTSTTIHLDGPAVKGPQPTYYVDGRVLDSTKISTIDPKDISFVNMLTGKEAQKLVGEKANRGVVLITTKANKNSPEVLAFNKAHNVELQFASPAQTAGMAAARAYIGKTYPSAKLKSVYEDKNKAGRYVARFEDGGQTKELHFDGQGQPVAQ